MLEKPRCLSMSSFSSDEKDSNCRHSMKELVEEPALHWHVDNLIGIIYWHKQLMRMTRIGQISLERKRGGRLNLPVSCLEGSALSLLQSIKPSPS